MLAAISMEESHLNLKHGGTNEKIPSIRENENGVPNNTANKTVLIKVSQSKVAVVVVVEEVEEKV